MVKNRVIAALLWVVFLLWVYARNRMTKAEHLEEQSRRIRKDPGYIQRKKTFEDLFASDPKFRKIYYESLYEDALEEIGE